MIPNFSRWSYRWLPMSMGLLTALACASVPDANRNKNAEPKTETAEPAPRKSEPPDRNLVTSEDSAAQTPEPEVQLLQAKAEKLTEALAFKEAAEEYDAMARDYREVLGDDGMCEVLFNEAVNYEGAKMLEEAIETRLQLVREYPECRHKCQVLHNLIWNYEAAGQVQKSIELRKKIAAEHPDCPSANEVQ